MRDPTTALLLGSVVALGAPQQRAAPPASASPAPDGGQWTMPAKDYAATRYSALTDITAANVKRLRAVWTFSSGVLGGHEGQPLVVNHTMYAVTPYPNVLYAFDLTREGYPLKWKYRPYVNPAAIGIACCDVINRGAFYADGKIVYNLLDGHTVAIDTATGKEVWKTQVAEVRTGETTPMAPLVAKDRVIVGTSGGEYGVRGWVKGLDLATGRVVWTAYNTGPDDEVLARPGTFQPFYDRGADLGRTSWPEGGWKHGGAPVWGWLSYDPELDLVYYGTGNPAPYNAEQRPGDNKWATSVLARRPADGSLVWAYQFTPADNWDYDAVQEMILADLTINLCMDSAAVRATSLVGPPFIGASTPYKPGPGGSLGAFIAWDAARGRKVWEIREKYPVWSGALATAGDVVFYGTLDGWFKAVDAKSGAPLWKMKVGSGVVGNPITFRGADHRQYVAVYAGIGGDWFLLSGDVRSDDPADVRPPADFMPDIARYTSQGGIVWLFAL